MLQSLKFLEIEGTRFKTCTNQIFSDPSDTASCFIAFSFPDQTEMSAKDLIASLKWFINSMTT